MPYPCRRCPERSVNNNTRLDRAHRPAGKPPIMSTPVKSTPVKAALPETDSPGTWWHPRLNEITRRRNATTFSEKNLRRIGYNIVALLAMWSVQLVARLNVDPQKYDYAHPCPRLCRVLTLLVPSLPYTFRAYLSWAWFVVQLVPWVQIAMACLPLLRTPDDITDIPLTAAQRKLLGLPPSSAPPTPDAKFSTPPRYSRTPSLAGSVGSRASYNSSPLSGRGSVGGSPSPYNGPGSPLLSKSMSGLVNGRRSSFGSASPFGANSSPNLFNESLSPSSPSPSGGKRTSVGLNSKWLYEKGRRSSGSARLH